MEGSDPRGARVARVTSASRARPPRTGRATESEFKPVGSERHCPPDPQRHGRRQRSGGPVRRSGVYTAAMPTHGREFHLNLDFDVSLRPGGGGERRALAARRARDLAPAFLLAADRQDRVLLEDSVPEEFPRLPTGARVRAGVDRQRSRSGSGPRVRPLRLERGDRRLRQALRARPRPSGPGRDPTGQLPRVLGPAGARPLRERSRARDVRFVHGAGAGDAVGRLAARIRGEGEPLERESRKSSAAFVPADAGRPTVPRRTPRGKRGGRAGGVAGARPRSRRHDAGRAVR